jgi:hypothetical protein
MFGSAHSDARHAGGEVTVLYFTVMTRVPEYVSILNMPKQIYAGNSPTSMTFQGQARIFKLVRAYEANM